MKRFFILKMALASAGVAFSSSANPVVTQWGANESVSALDVAADSAGNYYVVGELGSRAAQESTRDLFLRRYLANGSLAWARQLGGTASEIPSAVAVDSAGNAYLTGRSEAVGGGTGVSGQPLADALDAFLVRYNANGTLAWTRQIGTVGNDRGSDVAVDASGNVYLTGISQNGLDAGGSGQGAFLRKYSATGTLQWTSQILVDSGEGQSVAVNSTGAVYVAGYTLDSLDGTNAGLRDAFLMRYDATGMRVWTRQLGSIMHDWAREVAVDNTGNIYISGDTNGSLGGANSGGQDTFLARYTGTGTLVWVRQLGTSAFDYSSGLAVGTAGDAYFSGYTNGSLAGANNGATDVFLARYDLDGALLDSHQLGSDQIDTSFGAAVVSTGTVILCGGSLGDLGGGTSGFGFLEAFMAKYTLPFPAGDFEMSLQISRNGGNFDFQWNSRSGRFYDLVSNSDLSSPPSEWPVWQGLEGILASGTAINSLTAVPGGSDMRRFFSIVERASPP